MYIKVGRLVNVNEVDLLSLSNLDRIIASVISAYHNTNLYKRRFAESVERVEEQKRKVREALSDALLSAVSVELLQNKSLKSKDDVCVGVLVKVPSRFKSVLPEVLELYEFDLYETKIIYPSPILSKFSDAPILVYFESKGG